MWNAISNMIIKAADNMNRGVENATKAGEGSNGQNYQVEDTSAGSEGGGTEGAGTVQTSAQDTGSTTSLASELKGVSSNAKDAISNIGNNGGGADKSENSTDDDEKKNPIGGVANMPTPTTSDERLKNIFGDNEDIINIFSKIDAIQFTYNDKAKEVHPGEENGVDDDLHLGVKAQDLEKNPLTASTVSEDASGYKQVNTSELTMANSAVISELCKRLEIIEKVLGIKVV